MNIRWQTRDSKGNIIYITEERWNHIVDPDNHPEMEDFEEALIETLKQGKRQQDSLNPQKYFYRRKLDCVSDRNTQIEAVVLFRMRADKDRIVSNNYVVTAYLKH